MSKFVDFVVFVFDSIERLILVIVSRLVPWAAPLAPAYFVADAIQTHLQAPAWVGWAVGATVEGVGVAATHITLEMFTYNQTRRKTDPAAPFWLGIIVAGLYFLTGISLTVIVKIFPAAITAAPAAFFVLAIVAYITLALMTNHARRTQTIKAETAERRNQKRNRAEQGSGFVPETGGKTKQQAAVILAERPGISGAELGRELGKSERLGRRLKTELLPQIGANGKGE